MRLPLHDGFHCWIKRPAPAVWLVASCSIAIAAAAAVLAVAQATLWTPLPVTDPDALVRVWNDRHATDGFITPEEFVEWKRRQDVFDGLASYQPDHDVLLEIDNRLERLEALHVTTDLYDVLGVAPVAGRLFGPADAPSAAPEVAILSERAWRQLLNADPAIIGRRIALRTDAAPQPATVVGIVPDALDFRAWDGRRVDLYRPITDGIAAEGFGTYRVGNRYVIGRLRAGAERESAQRRFSVVAAEIARDVRVRRAGETRLRFEPLHDAFYGANRPFVRLLLVAALLVLAVAFTNAAGVAFALAGRRRREQAVRAALGADRVHLLKLHAREACVLGLCVVATTAVISQVFLGVLVALAPPELRRVEASAVGWQESAAMLGLVTAVIVVVTAAQAAGALRRPLSLSLQGAALATMSRSSLKLRQLIVAAQQAVVLALTVAGVLTAVSFWNLSSRPLGFVPENVVSIELELPRHLRASPERFLAFLDDVRREAYAAPRRRRVAFAFDTPLSHRYGFASVGVSGSPSVATVDNRVTDGFFGVLDIAILAGRDFRRSDYGQPVVVVNQQFARRYLGGTGRALGQSITVGGRTRPHEVIAVVGDVREQDLTAAMDPVVYQLLPNRAVGRVFLFSREEGAAAAALTALTAAVRAVDASVYATSGLLNDRVRRQTAAARMQVTLIGFLALFSTGLAGLGIYALVAQLSADRTRELGIRTALGATSRSLIVLLMRSIVFWSVGGILAGVALALLTLGLLERFLFEVAILDGRAWSVALVVSLFTAVTAAWVPARRAATADPLLLLRTD